MAIQPFDRPPTYQIIVQGKIDPNWPERLEGMKISPATKGVDTLITTLEGQLTDEAALAGVLNSLYELHLPVISVKWSNIW